MREERRKKEERRTSRQKQVPFHNRTHKTFLLIACVETPHSDLLAFVSFDVYFCRFQLQRISACEWGLFSQAAKLSITYSWFWVLSVVRLVVRVVGVEVASRSVSNLKTWRVKVIVFSWDTM